MEPTKAEIISESLACDRAMLAEWQRRATEAWRDEQVNAFEKQIEALNLKIADVREKHQMAPRMIAEYTARIGRQVNDKKVHAHRRDIKKLKATAAKIGELKAELEAMLASDPELAREMGRSGL